MISWIAKVLKACISGDSLVEVYFSEAFLDSDKNSFIRCTLMDIELTDGCMRFFPYDFVYLVKFLESLVAAVKFLCDNFLLCNNP